MVTYYLTCHISSTPFLLHQLFKAMKLAFMPPFPVPCSEDVFSSLLFSYSLSLLAAFWHIPTLLFSSLNLIPYLFLQNPSTISTYFTHATPSLTLSLNMITSWLPSHRCHPTHPSSQAQSSSSRQLFLHFCLKRK